MNKIKICHLSTVHSKKDIRIFYKECRTLAAAGHDVTYISQGVHDENIDGVRRMGIGIPVIKNKFKRMTKGCRKLIKTALAENADVYHIHDSELLRFIGPLKSSGKKIVYDSHEHLPMQIMEKEWLPPALRSLISKLADIYEILKIRYVDLIIVVADKTFERFRERKTNVVKIGNFPLIDEFADIKIDYNIKKSLNKICYTGAVWIERGLDTMCEAASGLNNCVFEIAGRIDHEDPEGFIEAAGDNIVYSGYLSREGVVGLYEESIAGVCLFKPFPNNMIDPPTKIFEYMAAGIPVIASKFKSITDIVEKYECGICVNPLNIDEIRNAMRYILDNPDKAEEMGRRGKSAILDKYNWEIHSKILLDAYDKLMETGNDKF